MSTWVIVLAAGSGSRLTEAADGAKKQFLPFAGEPLYFASLRTFARVARVNGVVVVFPEADLDACAEQAQKLAASESAMPALRFAAGGARRQDSVYNGLAKLPADCDAVLVHDSARPFASAALTNALLDALASGATAVIPAVPVTDTIKRVTGDAVRDTLDRNELAAVQTPQAFAVQTLLAAHENARIHDIAVTDDASMVEAMKGGKVLVIPGEDENCKITNPADLTMLTDETPPPLPITGFGYDVHKYGTGRPMKLGGVPIAGGPEVVAHSDGDVLLHALTDAILGCLGKGDIGHHFPETDAAFDNMESGVFVNEALVLAEAQGLTIHHVDLTIIAQVPKLSPHRDQIRSNVANLLRLPAARVNVKATTEEGLGFTGKKKGIKAVAVVSAMLGAKA